MKNIIKLIAVVAVMFGGLVIGYFHPLHSINHGIDNQTEKWIDISIPAQTGLLNHLGQSDYITIHAIDPHSPESVPLYKGIIYPNDSLNEFYGDVLSEKNSVPSEQEAPAIAESAMVQHGGIPADAYFGFSNTNYARHVSDTGEILKKWPTHTVAVYWRKPISEIPIVGQCDKLAIVLGENGEILQIFKIWRTMEYTGRNVSIIPLDAAIEKLQNSESLYHPMTDDGISITNISLGFYEKSMTEPQIFLEPVWVFGGATTRGEHVEFYVYARQFANFTATPASGKTPLSVAFTDTSDASPVKWSWDFGDGTNSTEQNPVHTYATAGTYNVSLKAWNDLGSDTMEKPFCISVHNPVPPVAGFTATPTNGTAPLEVRFNDTSTNTPRAWSWQFGDNTTSSLENPVHIYTSPGNFTVSLTAVNEDGEDTRTMAGLIQVRPRPDPIALIDQLITYINGQATIPKHFRTMWVSWLGTVKQDLRENDPGDAIVKMKGFRFSVIALQGWAISRRQAETLRDSADAIIAAIDVPVNRAALDQTHALKALVKDSGLPPATESLLSLQLDTAIFCLKCGEDEYAREQIVLFSGSVQSMDGRGIPHDSAMTLITKAEAIRGLINP